MNNSALSLSLKPLIMGILNVTPDSFSDGGRYTESETAVQQAIRLTEEGADIIDIGGESTRPGAKRISAAEQKQRLIDVIREVRKSIAPSVAISIDTTLSEVASAALEAGAGMINDVSAGRDDPDILSLVAEKNCPYIMMHMQGTPETMQDNPVYENVVVEIRDFLLERIEKSIQAGIHSNQIIIDPGVGFGKNRDHNLQLIANLKMFVDTGYPVLLGTSRKRFMGTICEGATPEQLIGATCATTAIGVLAGVHIFRVHDVKENRQAADVAWHIKDSYKR